MLDPTLSWQARCILCGWTSTILPASQAEAEADVHIATAHPRSPELQQWLESQRREEESSGHDLSSLGL
jgi:hypothetical protein